MATSLSLPELKLFTFTNNKSCTKSVTTPYQGRQIIKQRRAKSCNDKHGKRLKQERQLLYAGSANSARGRLSRPTSTANSHHPASRCISRTQTPGYTLTRTVSSVEIKINTTTFFSKEKKQTNPEKRFDKDTTNKKNSTTGDIIEKLTQESLAREEHLQREIVDLEIQLSYMEKKYDEVMQQKDKELELVKKKLLKGFEIDARKQRNSFECEMQSVHQKHVEDIELLQNQRAMEKVQFEEEIEHYKRIVEETKEEMQMEAEGRLKALEETMRTQAEDKLRKTVQSMKRNEQNAISQAKEKLTSIHEGKMKAIKDKYTAIIERLEGETLGLSKLIDDLDTANGTIEKMRIENKSLEEQLQKKAKEIAMLESKLWNTELSLGNLQENYQAKIRSFEERYFKQFDDLRLENTKLRSRVMEQVSTISDYRDNLDRLYSKGIANFRATIIQARVSADLCLIPQSVLNGEKLTVKDKPTLLRINRAKIRHLSAPSTDKEIQQVCNSIKKKLNQQNY